MLTCTIPAFQRSSGRLLGETSTSAHDARTGYAQHSRFPLSYRPFRGVTEGIRLHARAILLPMIRIRAALWVVVAAGRMVDMRPTDLKKLLRTEPFSPLRLGLSDGRAVVIRHPD